jgi:Flp pilus assembly protein TadD
MVTVRRRHSRGAVSSLPFFLTRTKRSVESVEALKKAYEIDPNDSSTAFNLGIELLELQNDPSEALPYLKQADKSGRPSAYLVISEIE